MACTQMPLDFSTIKQWINRILLTELFENDPQREPYRDFSSFIPSLYFPGSSVAGIHFDSCDGGAKVSIDEYVM